MQGIESRRQGCGWPAISEMLWQMCDQVVVRTWQNDTSA
jgi:hypothetical protein